MQDVLREAYRAQSTLPELLRELLRALAKRVPYESAEFVLHEHGALRVHRAGALFHATWHEGSDAAQAERTESAGLRVPVEYAGRSLGELVVCGPSLPADSDEHGPLCAAFARRCALLSMRYHVQGWLAHRLGRPLLLVGTSAALGELEAFIEQASRSSLPVRLTGEFGTERPQLAAAIHCSGPRACGPFVEINCKDPQGLPAHWFEQARGGTLFFNDIDELSAEWQRRLAQCFPSHFGQWLTGFPSRQPRGLAAPHTPQDARLIASTTADLRKLVADGQFSRGLFAELDFLSATVPPLRERREDIEYLVAAILERNSACMDATSRQALLAACLTHSWPENLFELERVVARLATLADGAIDESELQRHAPALVQARLVAPGPARQDPAAVGHAPTAAPAARGDIKALAPREHWVQCALARDEAAMTRLHESLRKALLYLGQHYAEPISLTQLARHCHVSASHLSYLFRTALGASFKKVLQGIRVEQAKASIRCGPMTRITEVAQNVGFTDLSHFEKSFRRLVGQSPREYRRSVSG